jgi:hypothetical protein
LSSDMKKVLKYNFARRGANWPKGQGAGREATPGFAPW